jgi:hypothetical protein
MADDESKPLPGAKVVTVVAFVVGFLLITAALATVNRGLALLFAGLQAYYISYMGYRSLNRPGG